MKWIYDDGGRKAAGYKGDADDCVCRAIAIATQRPYKEIYDLINRHGKAEDFDFLTRLSRTRRSSAREGVYKETLRAVMAHIGWRWVPTMKFGSGCKVHLRAEELPPGRLVVQVSRHIVAVVNGVVHDTHDPRRDGVRCVYGYWYEP